MGRHRPPYRGRLRRYCFKSGFTRDALDAARSPVRRLSLWTPRLLTLDDFAPDKDSPRGYIARVRTIVRVTEPHLVEGSFVLDTFRVDGKPQGREVTYAFSAAARDSWYLRDEQDNIVGNLWDVFIERATSANQAGVIQIIPQNPCFVVLSGVRLGVRRVAFEIGIRLEELTIDVDLLKRAIAYENALTRKVSIVPLHQVGHLELLAERPRA